ncbi:MAG: hypothetical protein ACKVS8_01640 [Phycisphaerales bacterium]
MPAPRSSSGSSINPATIKIIVAVGALAVAGGLLAYQLGLFGGSGVSVPDDVRKKVEAAAEEAKKNPTPPSAPRDPNAKPPERVAE